MINELTISKEVISKWRGFNLQEMFASNTSKLHRAYGEQGFLEEHFKIISELGFNFVRIPFSYRIWSSVDDPFTINDDKLRLLDGAVEYADKYNLHVNIAMHRAPGYCINYDETPEEKLNLWKDDEALEAFKYQWSKVAERYTSVSPQKLSYNVLNEPSSLRPNISEYSKICLAMIHTLADISPEHMIIIDGYCCGELPPLDLLNFRLKNCIYGCRGYAPQGLTHYGLGNQPENTTIPIWPGATRAMYFDKNGDMVKEIYDRERLEQLYDLWKAVSDIYDVPVFCGEFGCYNKTPHDITLAWMKDVLKLMSDRGIGFALWQLMGPFGILDSERADVEYENFYGHKLDRKMLDLLQKY